MSDILQKIKEINTREFKGIKPISVSKMNGLLSEKFDGEKQSKICEEKGKNDPNYKYYGMTAQQILESWNDKASESRRYGSMLDEYANYRLAADNASELEKWKMMHGFKYDNRLNKNCQGLDEFIEMLEKTTNYKFVGREITVYAKSANGNIIYGRLDCLFEDSVTHKLLIVDWKTNEEMKTKGYGGKKMYGPASILDDCDLSKYTLQVYTYKNALSETYGLTIPENIDTMIVNLLREQNEDGVFYKVYRGNIEYNKEFMSDVFDFTYYMNANA